jgi:hypothetical protein
MNYKNYTTINKDILTMQEGKLSFWHRVAHVLGLNSEFANVHVEDGYIVKSTTCNTCGKSRDTFRICKYSEETVAKDLQAFAKLS